MRQINLFKTYLAKPEKELKLAREAKVLSFVFLAVYCVMAAGIFSFWLVSKREIASLSEKVQFQEQSIRSFKETETLHVFVKQRLSAMISFFDPETIDYQQTLDQLESITPAQIRLGDITFSDKGGLKVSGQAPNAAAFTDYLDQLMGSAGDKFIQSAQLSSVARGREGSYSFTLNLDVGN